MEDLNPYGVVLKRFLDKRGMAVEDLVVRIREIPGAPLVTVEDMITAMTTKDPHEFRRLTECIDISNLN